MNENNKHSEDVVGKRKHKALKKFLPKFSTETKEDVEKQ